jgi:hypothetical protein
LLLPAAKGRPRGDRGRGPWRSGRRAAAPRSTRRSTPSGSPSPTQVRSRPPLSSPFPFRLLLSPIRFDPLTCPALLCSRARRWRRPHHGPRRHQVLRHVQAPPRRPQAGTARRSPLPSIPCYYCRALSNVPRRASRSGPSRTPSGWGTSASASSSRRCRFSSPLPLHHQSSYFRATTVFLAPLVSFHLVTSSLRLLAARLSGASGG